MNWYYAEGDRQVGPIEEQELLTLVDRGRITAETLVWRNGMPNWQPFGSIGDIPRSVQFEPPSREPFFLPEKVEEGVVAAPVVYAGFWIRFVAAVLDGVILVILSIFIAAVLALGAGAAEPAVFETLRSVIQLGVGAGYVTFFLGKFGATPGKMALGLRVVRSDGGDLTYARAFSRYLAEYLSALTLMIGYIIAAFDREKRALHDHICDTRVIFDYSRNPN
jgi:uncharacterized RDD family membrane protein YckC